MGMNVVYLKSNTKALVNHQFLHALHVLANNFILVSNPIIPSILSNPRSPARGPLSIFTRGFLNVSRFVIRLC